MEYTVVDGQVTAQYLGDTDFDADIDSVQFKINGVTYSGDDVKKDGGWYYLNKANLQAVREYGLKVKDIEIKYYFYREGNTVTAKPYAQMNTSRLSKTPIRTAQGPESGEDSNGCYYIELESSANDKAKYRVYLSEEVYLKKGSTTYLVSPSGGSTRTIDGSYSSWTFTGSWHYSGGFVFLKKGQSIDLKTTTKYMYSGDAQWRQLSGYALSNHLFVSKEGVLQDFFTENSTYYIV